MVLATLSQQTATGRSLTLYSFNRATGHINWQYDITQPAQAQSEDILGADNNFIYAVGTQPLAGQQTQVQLLAINQFTGYIGWRVNSPPEADGNPLDKGSLLLTKHALVWQVNATIQVIDATQGSILWTTTLPFSNISTLQQEEAQMVVLHGQLAVERNYALHSYDMTTGKKLWNVSVFDFSTGTTPASIATNGQNILVYGNGQLEAVSYSNQHVIWQQRQMGNILGFHISDDGTLIYVILLDSIENSTPAQALVAFDAQNGAARWTFQPSAQFTFLNPQSNGFQYHHNTILTTLCLTSTCNHPHLYALNAAIGATLWKFEGNGVSNPLMSTDGSIVSYVGNTSAWQQFIQGLSG
jgi:outer membrane protein assembly factor BamB